MSQVITNAFETYWQGCLTDQVPVVLDEVVLADIPNLDITAPIDPNTGLPPQAQIVHRHPVDQRGRINNNAVAYSIVMDTTVGNFSFNAMYLINKASGMVGMIVYKGRETKTKTDQATGTTGNSLVKSMLMEYDQAATATVTTVEAGTWQIDYSARLLGMDEQLRLQAIACFGSSAFFGDGFKLINKAGSYKVQPGVAMVGGLRIQLDAEQAITVGAKPVGVWVDVHRAGTILSRWDNHFEFKTSTTDLTDYTDSNGYRHYVAKLGVVQTDNTVTDKRKAPESSDIWNNINKLQETDESLSEGVQNLEFKLGEHEKSVNHPYATNNDKGLIRIANKDEVLAADSELLAVTPKHLPYAIQKYTKVSGVNRGIKMSADGLSSNITICADELSLNGDNGVASVIVNKMYIQCDANSIGIDGLDTGSLSASTWYSVWVIYNGAKISSLLSISETEPNMPQGYTHRRRIGWVLTSASKLVTAFIQRECSIQWKVPIQVAANGTRGMVSLPVPKTAYSAHLGVSWGGNGTQATYVLMAPDDSSGYSEFNAPICIRQSSTYGSVSGTTSSEMLLTVQNKAYYASTAAGSSGLCYGWRDFI